VCGVHVCAIARARRHACLCHSVCSRVSVFVCMCVCVCVFVCVCVCLRVRACVIHCERMFVCNRLYVCVRVHVYMCAYLGFFGLAHICTDLHLRSIHTRTNIHAL